MRSWILGLAVCLAVAGFFSTYQLLESPKTWFDEGIFIQVARNAFTHHGYVMRAAPDLVVPAGQYSTIGWPLVAPLSTVFYFVGMGLLQARVVMVIFILLMVAAVFRLSYEAFGARVALWSTLLIATHAPLYGNGKNVLGEVPGLCYFFVFLLLLNRLEQNRFAKTSLWIGTGLAAGVFVATKPSFILLLPMVGIVALFLRKRIVWSWKNVTCGIAALVAPILTNLVIQFGFTKEIFTSFTSYANMPGLQKLTGLTLPALIQKNALLFIQEATPAYLLVTVLVWIISLCVRYRRKITIPLHEYVALGFVTVTIAYFLKMPGFFRYLFVAQIVAFPYAVASCFGFASAFTSTWLTRRRLVIACTAVLSVMVAVQAYQVLFRSWVAAYYTSTRTSDLTRFFEKLDPSKHVFFYHAVEAVTFLKHENYSQYFEVLYFDDAFGKEGLISLQNGVPDVVIVAGSLEPQARAVLGKYHQTEVVNNGNYVIFERN